MFALLRTISAAATKADARRPSVRASTSSSVRDLFSHTAALDDDDSAPAAATTRPTSPSAHYETDASTVSSDSSERGGRIAAAAQPAPLHTHVSPSSVPPPSLPPSRIRAPSDSNLLPLAITGASPSTSSLLCPICRDILTAPVRPCHAFCRSCIATWSATQLRDGAHVATCPVCRADIPPIATLRVDAVLAAHVRDATRSGSTSTGTATHGRARARVDSRGESGIVGAAATALGAGRTPRVSFNHVQSRSSSHATAGGAAQRPRMAVPSMGAGSGTPVALDAAVETVGGGRPRTCSSPMKRAALSRYRSRSRTASVIAPPPPVAGMATLGSNASAPTASPGSGLESDELDPLARTPWPMPALALGPPALQLDDTGATLCLYEAGDTGEVVAVPVEGEDGALQVAYIARIRAVPHDGAETVRFGLRLVLSRAAPGAEAEWEEASGDDVLVAVTPHMTLEEVLHVLRNGVISHALDVLCVQSRPCESRALRAAVAIHCVSEHAAAAPFLSVASVLSSLAAAPLSHHTHRIATVSCCTSIANVLAHSERGGEPPDLGREVVAHMLSKLAYTLTCIMGDPVCVCAVVAALTHVAARADTDTLCECMGIAVSALCDCVGTHMRVKDVVLACVGLMKRLAVTVDLPKETAQAFVHSLAQALDVHGHDADLCVAVCDYVVTYADTRSRAKVCARAGVHSAIARCAAPPIGGVPWEGVTALRVQSAARAALAKVQDSGCVTQ